jgi:hypothetical protein
MASAQITRRAVIVGGATLAVAAACGGGSDDDANSETADDTAADASEPTSPELILAAGFATGDRTPAVIAAGHPQRVMFTVADISQGFVDPVRADLPDTLAMVLHWPEDVGRSEEIASERRDSGIPTPYFPIVFTPESPGNYRVETTVGGETLEANFLVDPPETIPLVQVGDPMRPVDTPTFDDSMGVDPICTRAPEPCPFHDQTLTAALESGKPVALLVSTPGFCQTAICGPVLDLVIAAQENFPDVTFVHAEVYNDPTTLGGADFAGTAPVVDAYGMTFEPSLIVADATGTVTSRLDFTFDAVDLDAALATSS